MPTAPTNFSLLLNRAKQRQMGPFAVALDAIGCELDGSHGRARELWMAAKEMALESDLSGILERFRLDSIAYLLPPSEFSLELLRTGFETTGDLESLERYASLLHRFSRDGEARQLLEDALNGNGRLPEDGDFIFLCAALLPRDNSAVAAELKKILLSQGEDWRRLAALRIAVERSVGCDQLEIASPSLICCGDLRWRTTLLSIAGHYLDCGDYALADRFLNNFPAAGPDQCVDETVLLLRISLAMGRYSDALNLVQALREARYDNLPALLLVLNGQFMGGPLRVRWNGWLDEFFSSGKATCDFSERVAMHGKLTAVRNYMAIGDLLAAENLIGQLVGSRQPDGGVPDELSAEIKFELLRLAVCRSNWVAAKNVASLLRTRWSSSDCAMESYFLMADAFRRAGRGIEAVGEFRDFLEKYGQSLPVPRALLELAQTFGELGDDVAAFAVLEKIVTDHGDSPYAARARLLEGDMLRLGNDFAAAEAVYRSIPQQFPVGVHIPFAKFALAKCLLAAQSQNGLSEAIEILEWLAAERVEDPNFAAEISYVLALALRRRDGNGAQASEIALGHSIDSSTLNFRGYYWLGR
jgi:tetratricopeptide (TPR) repeat protein